MSKVKGQGHHGQKRCLALPTPPVHTNGMRLLKTASSSSGWVHFVAARGCFQMSSASSTPLGKSVHAVWFNDHLEKCWWTLSKVQIYVVVVVVVKHVRVCWRGTSHSL